MKIILLILLFGCNNQSSNYIKSYKIPKASSTQTKISQNEHSHLPFSWEVPNNWISNIKSSMRAASYSISSSKGNADLSVIYLDGNGGGNVANVNRWRKQLDLSDISEKEIESNSQNFNSDIGPYKIYKIINKNNKESGFLCSIIPANSFTIFIKLNTHVDVIDELEEQFIDFSSSFKYNE